MKKYLLLALPLLALVALPILANAQTFVPLADTATQGSRLADLYSSNNLADYINKIFTAAIALGAVAAVLRLAYAGYLYMGSDMWSKKGEAKTVIGDVTLGLLLLLSIWLILYQINPNILKLNALQNIKPVNQSQTQGGASAASVSPYTGIPAATENKGGIPVDQNGTPLQ
jgi:hypothetical protein